MRLEINLASQPYEDLQRFMFRWSMALLGVGLATVILVYMAGSAYFNWRKSDREVTTLRTEVADRDREKEAIEAVLAQPENDKIRQRALFVNGLIARKAFSWTEVFSDLEKLVPPELHVTLIRPVINDSDQLEVHLSVAGSNREQALELVRSLEQSPHFMRAEINSESAHKPEQNNTDTIQFDISAVYLPGFARQSAANAEKEARNGGR
jgi:Tfp pilus assembly protein PilN